MAQVVQVKCPKCQNVLRIPADWLDKPLRCKHCQTVIQGKKPAAVKPAAPLPPTTPPPTKRILPMPPPPMPAVSVSEPMYSEPAYADDEPGLIGDGPTAQRLAARKKRKNASWAPVLIVGAVLLGLAGSAVGAAVYYRNAIAEWWRNANAAVVQGPEKKKNKEKAPPVEEANDDDDKAENPKPLDGTKEITGQFPRRLLAISVNNYLYANPITYGNPDQPEGKSKDNSNIMGGNLNALLDRFKRALHIPESQIVQLSDGALPRVAKTPLKPVVEKTISDFLDASRAQDRIIVLFIGHALDVDNVPYLVPIEGDLTDKDTLIPLSWLYEQLDKCKAKQKVLIMDVCRYDPGRGLERPGSGDMGEKLDEALQKPPDGVQVWSACVKGQKSYEFDDAYMNNGALLEELYWAVGPFDTKPDKRPGKINLGLQRPQDALPLEKLVKIVNKRTEETVKEALAGPQTPRFVGKERSDGATYDPNEPLPGKQEIKIPPPADGTPAVGLASIRSILGETTDVVPPVRFSRNGSTKLKAESLPPFSSKILEAYKADDMKPEDVPFRKAILNAETILGKANPKNFMEELRGNNPGVKAAILNNQREPAKIHGMLMEALEELKEVGGSRKEEKSKRWQANYDFVLSQVAARLAYIYEYNLMLGKIRKDELPELGPKQKGWRMSSRQKLNTKEAKDFAADAKKALDRLAKEHKGTPWEVFARRERLTSLGLEWQATSFAE